MGRRAPILIYLLFADDSLLFLVTYDWAAQNLVLILHLYENLSLNRLIWLNT